MGKAATLNGRVGDVMIPNVVYDEHSRNTFLFKNCFLAQHVAPYLLHGTVFDNQKAVTVRGTFLQNREFMGVFYREGYTDLEMEAGPYLSAIYEDIYPQRYPGQRDRQPVHQRAVRHRPAALRVGHAVQPAAEPAEQEPELFRRGRDVCVQRGDPAADLGGGGGAEGRR